MRLCKVARFCESLRVSAHFLCVSVRFFLPKWPAEKRKIAHNRAKMCKKRFYAIPPLVIPPFACHRVNKSARERIGRQNLSQKVPSKKGSLGVIFSPRKHRETHTQNLQILREDTLGATCSAGPFCLLPVT